SMREKKWPLEDLLLNDKFWDDTVVLRVARVLAMAEPVVGESPDLLLGSPSVPYWLRIVTGLTARAVTIAAHRTPAGSSPGSSDQKYGALGAFTAQRCLSMLRLAQEPEEALVGMVFEGLDRFYMGGYMGVRKSLVKVLAGTEDYLRCAGDVLARVGPSMSANARVNLMHTLGRLGQAEANFDWIFEQGVGSARTARDVARAVLLSADPAQILAAGEQMLRGGNASQRAQVASLLSATLKQDARALLAAHLETEKAKRVREALQSALTGLDLAVRTVRPQEAPDAADTHGGAEVPPSLLALDGTPIARTPMPSMPPDTPVSDEDFAHIEAAAASFNTALAKLKRELKGVERRWWRECKPLSAGDIKIFRALANGERTHLTGKERESSIGVLASARYFVEFDRSGLEAFYSSDTVTVHHLVRVARAWRAPDGLLLSNFYWHQSGSAFAALGDRMARGLDIRIVASLWRRDGIKEEVRRYLGRDHWGSYLDHDTDFDRQYPMLAMEHLELVDEALGLVAPTSEKRLHPHRALKLLTYFEQVPQRYLPPLMEFATGERKTLRVPARKLLAGAPQLDEGIATLLEEGRQQTRASAADWLAERGARSQVPAIVDVLEREKAEVARAAMLSALDRLGEDISGYFDAKALLAEAQAGLKKVKLKSLAWFPFDAMPPLELADGTALDSDIPRWWLALANKLKQAGGNALFDLYLSRLAPAIAERFSSFILQAWIAHDTQCPSEAEANAYAKANAGAYYKSMVSWQTSFTPERAFAQLKRHKLSEYLTTASANKGILGLTTAAPGALAADAGSGYLKNHGSRVSQAKALLDTLAANPSPAAIQVVLATANRFKARTVQAHAQALIEQIAERRGWSPEQLADRTIPTGGFDERGVLGLDCGGERIYRAVLAEDGRITLENPAGKTVKSLPGARNEQEEPLIKSAKKALSVARKELKQVNEMQRLRLFEAMCLERVWAADEWQSYVLRHPIVGRMCQRLVWIGLAADDTVLECFRPLEDGSLSNVHDDALDPTRVHKVKLAHQTLLDEQASEAWREHLADYEVEPLFDQLSRPLLMVDASNAGRSSVDDRRGYMIESFKLRGAATKLGYARGEAMDGGVFSDYVKRYESAGLVVCVEFTGSPLPEENIACALLELKFYAKQKRGYGWGEATELKDVPVVLLSEAWNDLHQIAAAGTGFDEAWEKKASYW
ncbi:MAG: DUF4132 domain-containing protein, partial [Gammaproteobacteria bacterium]